MTTFITVHALRAIPTANLNRDDTNRPKTVVYGGVERMSYSSQSAKKAIRDHLRDTTDISTRTRLIPEYVAKRALELTPETELTLEEITAKVAAAFDVLAAKKKDPKAAAKADTDTDTDAAAAGPAEAPALGAVFAISDKQRDALAKAIMSEIGLAKKDVFDALSAAPSVDLIMAGRMYADDKGLNIDGAMQIAPAMGTGPVDLGRDFYTAVDEVSGTSGAAMMGDKLTSSGTAYTFMTINLDRVREHLNAADAATAIGQYISAFLTVLPSGSQSNYAALPPIRAAAIEVHDSGLPVSYAPAFEEPVVLSSAAAGVLAAYQNDVLDNLGSTPAWAGYATIGSDATFAGGKYSVPALIEALESAITAAS